MTPEPAANRWKGKKIRLICIDRWQTGGYLDMLHGALRKQNVEVLDPFSPASWSPQRYDILHLHAPQYHWALPEQVQTHAFYRRGFLHFRSWLLIGLFLGRLFRRRMQGKAIVWTAHDIEDQTLTDRRAVRWAKRMLASLCDAIICHTENAKRALLRRWPVPPGKVRVPPFPGGLEKGRRERLHISRRRAPRIRGGDGVSRGAGICYATADLEAALMKIQGAPDSLLQAMGDCNYRLAAGWGWDSFASFYREVYEKALERGGDPG